MTYKKNGKFLQWSIDRNNEQLKRATQPKKSWCADNFERTIAIRLCFCLFAIMLYALR